MKILGSQLFSLLLTCTVITERYPGIKKIEEENLMHPLDLTQDFQGIPWTPEKTLHSNPRTKK